MLKLVGRVKEYRVLAALALYKLVGEKLKFSYS